jgi:3-phenylpropionate/trans-cinnamate dioxygenase ferredoxin component
MAVDDEEHEMAEKELVIIPHNNGPYEVRSKAKIITEGGRVLQSEETEAWLCRCGQSASKPFCDGTHTKVGFQSDLEVSPPSGGGWEDACADSDVKEGDIKGVRIAGQRVVVGRVSGRLYAIGGTCTHQKALLEEGELDGKIVRCPLHDSGFDITTGQAVRLPAVLAVPTFDLKVEGGRVLVARKG